MKTSFSLRGRIKVMETEVSIRGILENILPPFVHNLVGLEFSFDTTPLVNMAMRQHGLITMQFCMVSPGKDMSCFVRLGYLGVMLTRRRAVLFVSIGFLQTSPPISQDTWLRNGINAIDIPLSVLEAERESFVSSLEGQGLEPSVSLTWLNHFSLWQVEVLSRSMETYLLQSDLVEAFIRWDGSFGRICGYIRDYLIEARSPSRAQLPV